MISYWCKNSSVFICIQPERPECLPDKKRQRYEGPWEQLRVILSESEGVFRPNVGTNVPTEGPMNQEACLLYGIVVHDVSLYLQHHARCLAELPQSVASPAQCQQKTWSPCRGLCGGEKWWIDRSSCKTCSEMCSVCLCPTSECNKKTTDKP